MGLGFKVIREVSPNLQIVTASQLPGVSCALGLLLPTQKTACQKGPEKLLAVQTSLSCLAHVRCCHASVWSGCLGYGALHGIVGTKALLRSKSSHAVGLDAGLTESGLQYL